MCGKLIFLNKFEYFDIVTLELRFRVFEGLCFSFTLHVELLNSVLYNILGKFHQEHLLFLLNKVINVLLVFPTQAKGLKREVETRFCDVHRRGNVASLL